MNFQKSHFCRLGKSPLPTKGTHVEFILSAEDKANEWGGYIKSQSGNALHLVITTPASIAVGKWSLKIDVVKREDTSVKVFRYEHKDPIYMLFNPWCKGQCSTPHFEPPVRHTLNMYLPNV